jgi:hypothetical protein
LCFVNGRRGVSRDLPDPKVGNRQPLRCRPSLRPHDEVCASQLGRRAVASAEIVGAAFSGQLAVAGCNDTRVVNIGEFEHSPELSFEQPFRKQHELDEIELQAPHVQFDA